MLFPSRKRYLLVLHAHITPCCSTHDCLRRHAAEAAPGPGEQIDELPLKFSRLVTQDQPDLQAQQQAQQQAAPPMQQQPMQMNGSSAPPEMYQHQQLQQHGASNPALTGMNILLRQLHFERISRSMHEGGNAGGQ